MRRTDLRVGVTLSPLGSGVGLDLGHGCTGRRRLLRCVAGRWVCGQRSAATFLGCGPAAGPWSHRSLSRRAGYVGHAGTGPAIGVSSSRGRVLVLLDVDPQLFGSPKRNHHTEKQKMVRHSPGKASADSCLHHIHHSCCQLSRSHVTRMSTILIPGTSPVRMTRRPALRARTLRLMRFRLAHHPESLGEGLHIISP